MNIAFSDPSVGLEPIHYDAVLAEDGSWTVGDLVLPPLQRWSVRINVLISDFERVSLETDVLFRQEGIQ